MSLNNPDHTKVLFPIKQDHQPRLTPKFEIETKDSVEAELDSLRQAPVELASEILTEFEESEDCTSHDDRADLKQALEVLIANGDYKMGFEVAKNLASHADLDLTALRLILETFQKNYFHSGEEAILLLLEAKFVGQKSELFDIYKSLGNARLKMQDFEGAEESYFKAFRIDPSSPILLVNIGTLEYRKNQVESARERFVEALNLDPENDKAWVGLALAHSGFADFDLCLANLERALQINPMNRTAIQLYVDIGFKHGHLQKVADRLDDYLKQNPDDLDLLLSSAKIAFVLSRYKVVKEQASRILELDLKHQEAKQLLAVSTQRQREASEDA